MHRGPIGKLRAAASAFYRRESKKELNPFIAGIAALNENQIVEVWPENWPAFQLFVKLQTQWLTGVNGRTGLNYSSLFPLMDRLKLSDSEYENLFDDIRVLELAALEEMNQTSEDSNV